MVSICMYSPVEYLKKISYDLMHLLKVKMIKSFDLWSVRQRPVHWPITDQYCKQIGNYFGATLAFALLFGDRSLTGRKTNARLLVIANESFVTLHDRMRPTRKWWLLPYWLFSIGDSWFSLVTLNSDCKFLLTRQKAAWAGDSKWFFHQKFLLVAIGLLDCVLVAFPRKAWSLENLGFCFW